MNRTIGRFLILGIVGLALSLGGRSTAKAQWSWWDGGYYNYGVGYSPYAYGYGYSPYSTNYWPSQYYVGYGSYSLWPGSCCGGCGTCGGGCGSSCGSCSSYCSSGCCGVGSCGGGCGVASCGGPCGSGCGLACGPSCGCSGGCGVIGSSGCGATAPTGKPKPIPEGEFQPRTYDPDAPPRTNERAPKPASPTSASGPGSAGPPPAGADVDTGTGRYSRDRAGDGAKPAPTQPLKDKDFDLPATKPSTTTPPPGGASKGDDMPFETKKPILQRGTDKKAPISTPDDAVPEDTSSKKKAKPDTNPDLKKPSAELEDKSNERTRQNAPALTLQDRSTWHLTGVSRPLFGRIANRPAPTPERLTSSNGDWAVFSADEAQVVRR
jgi:hypothetical protein